MKWGSKSQEGKGCDYEMGTKGWLGYTRAWFTRFVVLLLKHEGLGGKVMKRDMVMYVLCSFLSPFSGGYKQSEGTNKSL